MGHWLRYDLGLLQRSEGANWYGNPYRILNSMPKMTVSPQALLFIQKKSFQQNNLKVQKDLDIFNKTIDQINNLYHQEISNQEDFFSVFLKQLNKGYEFVSENQEMPKKSLQEISRYEQEICKFLILLSKYTNTEIPNNIFYNFKRMITHIREGEKGKFPFKIRKAQLWEEISQWVLSAAGFTSYGIGQVIDEYGKQLVQDTIGFLGQGKYPENSTMKIKITGKDQSHKEELFSSLKERGFSVSLDNGKYSDYFIIDVGKLDISNVSNLLQQTSSSIKKKITIKINETFIDQLKKYFTVQVKSGNYQSLLNNTNRDLIDAENFSEWSNYLEVLINFAKYRSNKSLETESKNLEAYTNYIFSKNIARTTLGKNTVFLSHYGFGTLDQYMSKNKFYFKLMPAPNTLKKLATQSFQIGEKKLTN